MPRSTKEIVDGTDALVRPPRGPRPGLPVTSRSEIRHVPSVEKIDDNAIDMNRYSWQCKLP